MTREGEDGINTDAAGMDHNIPVVAYYIDSPSFTWTPAEIAMFPNSVHVRIATRWTTRDGHVIDCENGDATPAQAAAWVHQRRADGYAYPMVYCSISNQGAVIAALNAIGEPSIGDGWWLAHYDNLDQLPAGVLGKQYADPGPLDRSIWADYIPGVDDMTNPLQANDPNFLALCGRVGALSQALPAVNFTPSTINKEASPGGAALASIPGIAAQFSAGETAILAAVQGVVAGTVDVAQLAQALVPLLSQADLDALKAQLNK